jgi:hypothetical protein
MIDLLHVPETPGLSVFLPQGVDANSWQTWQKPRGFVMTTIYAIGPGGGGGSGRAASIASGTVRGGGAGGGSGGLSRLTIPLFLLPDTLYIRVTPGGSGGASSTSPPQDGTAGNVAFAPSSTLVGVYPSTTAQYLFLAANAGGGGGGGSTGTATAGAAAGISATTSAPLGNLGATLFIAGNAGASGGTTIANSIDQGSASQIYGGAGGGGAEASNSAGNAGGQINGITNTPFRTSPGGVTSATPTAGGAGFSWTTIFPLKHYGGTGGASRGNGDGAAGGNGGVPGAGGGGGGGGGLTGGAGGDGGPGCVIIQCW